MGTLCFALSRRMVLDRKTGAAGENPATFSRTAYQEWRAAELRGQFMTHFDPADLRGRDILDFGCGEGDLSFLVAAMGVGSVTGIDLSEPLIQSATARAATLTGLAARPRFFTASNPKTIDLPEASIDVILCFDVLEHIMDYEDILNEWRRLLRPAGRVFIWWVPWLHPYGHHIESLVPIPWAHVIFPERVLIETCARIYDLPEFKPRVWDLDGNGGKKPNKWRALDRLPGLNRLTIARFEALCRESGLRIEERAAVGFGGSSLARLTRALTRIPRLRELFCSQVIYKLRRGP
jgi:SAM-dependent methyltransferase